MKVTEIYKSIQGESSYAGLPCTFVRLTGCNLRCSWCDTAYSFNGGQDMMSEQVFQEIEKIGCGLVEFTGGEPLLQQEVFPFITKVLNKGYEVLVETGGSIDLSPLDQRCVKIMDVKCPGSGESDMMCWPNINLLQPKDEVKFVIIDRTDYEWSKDIVRKYGLDKKAQVLFSPVFEKMPPRQLAQWILADKLNVRFQIQVHKYIWNPATRGV